MEFLSSLYKESADTVLYGKYEGALAEQLQREQHIATAKLCNMLFNLPDVVKSLEEEFVRQVKQKERFVKAQESGSIGLIGKAKEKMKDKE